MGDASPPAIGNDRPRAASSLSRATVLAAAAASLVPGCVQTPRAAVSAASPVFAPLRFFAGRTEGNGTLRTAMTHARAVHVVGDGWIDPDGSLVLVQRVEEGGRPARTRTWRLRALADGRFTATLSDAIGPVAVVVSGDLLHIRFRARGGLGVEQWIMLRSDGRTATNRMVVRKFGLPVAQLDETIRRMGD